MLSAVSKRLSNVADWVGLARDTGYDPGGMAARCRVHLRTLERFFRRNFRKTPTEWMLELRCRLAAERILEGYSTKAAAQEFGFSDPPHFCREFKKRFGVTPQNYVLLSSAVPSGPKLSLVFNKVVSVQSLAVDKRGSD